MKRDKTQFNELLLAWLEEIRISHAPSTYVKYYRMSARYIMPHFTGSMVNEITILELKQYREYLLSLAASEQLTDGSVRCLIMIVNAVMNEAFKRHLTPDLVHIFPGIKKRKHIVQVFSMEEQKRLERHIKRNLNITTLSIYLCLYTGLRLGEICALRWENINLDEGFIHVKYTVQRLGVIRQEEEQETIQENMGSRKKSELILTAPKSSSSNRLVPIPSFLLSFLEFFEENTTPDQFVLSGNPYIPMEPRTFQYQYKRCLDEAGLRYRNFHSVRHTFATRCITVGMDPKTLSEILGHSDIKITLEYYFHSSFEFKKDQMERLISIS